jgi:hypothetical protein
MGSDGAQCDLDKQGTAKSPSRQGSIFFPVIPAQAGTQFSAAVLVDRWFPACAGMTVLGT